MPVYECLPDANLSSIRGGNGQQSWSGGNTGSTVPAVLADSSDSTYTRSRAQGRPQDIGLAAIAAPAGAAIAVSVTPFARTKRNSPRSAYAVVAAVGSLTYKKLLQRMAIVEGTTKLSVPSAGSAGDHELTAPAGQIYNPVTGEPWGFGSTTIDPALVLYDNAPTTEGATGPAYFYKAGAKVYVLAGATSSPVGGPTLTVTDTPYPTLAATIGAVVEAWQVAGATPWLTGITVTVEVTKQGTTDVVYKATEHIDLSEYVDGSTPSTYAFSHTMTEPLDDGYYTVGFAAVRDVPWSGDAAKVAAWGTCPQGVGSPHTLHMNLTRPAVPVLEATLDDTAQHIAIAVTLDGTAFDDATFRVDVQRSDDDGATWTDVRGMKDVAATVGEFAMGCDYWAPRGLEVRYRARCCAEADSNAMLIYSEWCSPVVLDSWTIRGWNLKPYGAETSSWIGAPVKGEPASSLEEPSTVMLPLDREGTVVVTGGQYGTSGDYSVSAVGAAQIAALATIVEHQGVVYVETPYGEALWVRIVAPSWSYAGTLSSPRRRATLPWREVTEPEA